MRHRRYGGYCLGAVALALSLAAGCASTGPTASTQSSAQASSGQASAGQASSGQASSGQASPQQARPAESTEPLTLVVMDPLAKELACACVEGFGQRDYRKLAAHLQAGLGREVAVEFSDDLSETLDFVGEGRDVIIVGERALVTDGAKRAKLEAEPVC